jgi:hypothetical protein
MRLVVLVAYSGVIAALWFGLPRLLWPDRYIPKPAFRPVPTRPQAPAPRPGRPGVPPPRGAEPPPRPEPPRPGARPAPRPPQAPPDRVGPQSPAGPPRGRDVGQPPSDRPRENWGQRDASDATVFIPPSKKPGGSS